MYMFSKLILNTQKKINNDYPLVPDENEIKREMLQHNLKITDLCNIPIGNVKKLVSNLFDEEK